MSLQDALTKAEKARRVRAILDYGLGPVDAEHAAWLIANVFERHPRWGQKSAGGVVGVEVRLMPPYNSKCFYLLRTDGAAVDISFRESLNPSTQTGKIRAAARCEIEKDIRVWKIKNPAPEGLEHCDHIEPFDRIWRDFLAQHELIEEHISVVSDPVGRADYFENRKLSHSWQRYHHERATFQWLSVEANVAKSNSTAEVA